MAIEDAYEITPIPQVDELSLGVPPAPQPPPLPPMSQPVMQQGGQKALSLATLAAMITGGPNMAPLGRGVLQGQQMLDQQRQQQDRETRLRYDDETQRYRVEQMAYQQQMQARQKVLMDAVGGIRSQVAAKAFKSKGEYDAAVEQTAALLQNAYGMRVSPNYFRDAARYAEPSVAEKASQQFAALMKNPLTQEAMKADPGRVAGGRVSFDANGDGVAELITVQELAAYAGQPFASDDQGRPIAPTKEQGKIGSPFQEFLGAAVEQFRVENNREPSAAERKRLTAQAVEASKEKPPSAGGDPAVKALALETAQLRRDLLEQQLADAKNKPPKEPSQAQFTAAGYAERVQQAEDILNGIERDIAGMRTVSFMAQERMPPAGQSGAYQSYDQAARNFINAVLRRESGAAISPSEFDNARRQYLPQPGDKPATLAQKRQNREQVLTSLKAAAGTAIPEAVSPMPSHGKKTYGKYTFEVER